MSRGQASQGKGSYKDDLATSAVLADRSKRQNVVAERSRVELAAAREWVKATFGVECPMLVGAAVILRLVHGPDAVTGEMVVDRVRQQRPEHVAEDCTCLVRLRKAT